MAKGCPLLEHIDLHVEAIHVDELIALSSLRRLRSVFIHMHVNDNDNVRIIMPKDREDFCVLCLA